MDREQFKSAVKGRLAWGLGSFFVHVQTNGMWGRKARERRLIHRLLTAYPTLNERPRDELPKLAWDVLASLETWHANVVAYTAATAAIFLCTPVFILLRNFDLAPSNAIKVLICFAVFFITRELVRRHYIRRAMDRAVAAAYPRIFCACGYCKVGLPGGSRCPECGAA